MRFFPCGEGDDSSHHAAEIGNEARATAARVTSRVRAAHRPFDAAARLCAKYAWSESRVMFSNDGTAIEGSPVGGSGSRVGTSFTVSWAASCGGIPFSI